MTSDKNSLCDLSREQSNPFLCDPNSWEIVRDDDEIFHGQRSDKLQKESDAECKRKPAKRSLPTEASDAGKPHTP
jgi:hypothetical protein